MKISLHQIFLLSIMACVIAALAFTGAVMPVGDDIARALSAGLGASLVLALLLRLVFSRKVVRPLTGFTDQARSIAQGGWGGPAPRSNIPEINELGRALHAVARLLKNEMHTLSTEKNQAQAVLESMAEGVLALDAEDRIAILNPSAASLFGTDLAQAPGKPLLEVVRLREVNELVEEVRAQGLTANREFTIYQPTERTLRATAVLGRALGSARPSVVMVFEDLTEVYRYERLRKAFVANVSHELKSPLTGIRSLAETLKDGAINDPANNRRFVELIDQEAARLTRLVDDLLQLAQLELKESPPRVKAIELKPIVDEVLSLLKQPIEKRRLTVKTDFENAPRIQADPERIRQVFMNLIGNAVSYNRDGGSVSISARSRDHHVEIAVEDTGIGIPEKDLPRIFERFYRVDEARSRSLGGTGLGLAIVKHIVEAHQGRVWVTSRPDQGSAFMFTLPL